MLSKLSEKGFILPILISLVAITLLGLFFRLVVKNRLSKTIITHPSNITVTPPPLATSSYSPSQFQSDNFGVNTGIALGDPRMDEAMKMAADAGIGWIKIACYWDQVEPQENNWTWEFCDQVINNVTSAGLKPTFGLSYAPQWCSESPATGQAGPGGVPVTSDYRDKSAPCDYQKFYNYVYQVVLRYGAKGQNKVTVWEVGNEPDLSRGMLLAGPEKNPAAEYAHILKTAYDAVKAADPNGKVLYGGLAMESQYLPNFFYDSLHDKKYPAAENFDIANFHTYNTKEATKKYMDKVKADLASVGTNKPVWVTEVGSPSNSRDGIVEEDRQANYLKDMLPYILSIGVEKVFWFTLLDSPRANDEFCTEGLIYFKGYQCLTIRPKVIPNPIPPLTAKKAYFSFKDLISSSTK